MYKYTCSCNVKSDEKAMITSHILPSTGIDDISIYIPNLYLDIHTFAKARNIDPLKLEKGLGLKSIAIPDASEDVITMAAEALLDLVEKNNLLPGDLGRIYVGTESMVDGSKPNASYLLGILKQYYEQKSIPIDNLNRCDVVDMTFACIGAVDAMQNCLDWIKLNPTSKAIVIATDWAKYDLHSPGECTQGSGAIATLLSAHPRLIEIDNQWGVSTQCEHDFFKPLRRKVNVQDLAVSNGIDKSLLGKEINTEHKDTPVYDGHFSNTCYTDRISEAFQDFRSKTENETDWLNSWERMVFHLPYAYHARRVFIQLFIEDLKKYGRYESFISPIQAELSEADPKFHSKLIKAASKSEAYRKFVETKIAPGETASSLVGNMYTGSIFLCLVSHLLQGNGKDLGDSKLGFFAYGSGSKAKVFSGKVVKGYEKQLSRIKLLDQLDSRKAVNMHEYEYLHRHKLLYNLDSVNRKIFQTSSGWTATNRYARNYSLTL